MRFDDFEIERRLAEALGAAAGRRGSAVESLAEAALGSGGVRPAQESAAAAVSALAARLESLARPAAPSVSSWQEAAASLSPILGGLLRLFGGSEPETPPPLPPAARPEAVRYEAAYEPGRTGLFLVDRDAYGRLRPGGPLTAPVVVQVDAIDSRSFMERAPEIAEALRKALLESDGIRGVLDE